MKLRSLSLAALSAGLLSTGLGLALPYLVLQNRIAESSAVSIIGGADAPTYQFIVFGLLNGWPFCLVLLGLCLILTALFCLLFPKTALTHCTLKTTALSLGLSAVGASGLVCAFVFYTIAAFGEASRYPVAYPGSIIVGLLSLFGFVVLITLYARCRSSKWSLKGLVIDGFTSLLYLPALFFLFSYLYQLI